MDDDELLERARAGDQAAVAALCQRHWGLVGRFFASKVGEAVEDLRQQTFERFIDALPRYERRASLRAFIAGIAKNVLLEFLRKRYRSDSVEIDERSLADLGVGPSSALRHRENEQRVLHALRRIPIAFQVVLELTYWESMSDTEIAEVLDIPANTVRSRRGRAKERLRAELAKPPDDDAPPVLTETPKDFDAWAERIEREVWEDEDEDDEET